MLIKESTKAAGHNISSAEDGIVPVKKGCLIDMKIAMAVPEETYRRIAPKCGLAVKNGIDILASVVDVDY